MTSSRRLGSARPGLRLLLFILPAFVMLPACRSVLWSNSSVSRPWTAVGGAVLGVGSALRAPFRTTDHIRFTRMSAADALARNRVRPATTVTGRRPLTLADCRAIALNKNLKLQVSRLDEISKRAIVFSAKTKMLPHLLVTGELSERNNYRYAFSDVMGREGLTPDPAGAGAGVTSWSTGHERNTHKYSLELKWSPTDAALAYYLAGSNTNDTLKAHYKKVRVAQKLIAAIDSAFFRLLSVQRSLPQALRLKRLRAETAERTAYMFERGLVSLEKHQAAKRALDKSKRLVRKLWNEREIQRNILASAMALSPDYCVDGGFQILGRLPEPRFAAKMCDLEMTAVQNRPEAYEAGLNHLNSTNDLKRTIVRYCPKITGFWRHSREDDRYLWNKEWGDLGVTLKFDLVEWMSNLYESQSVRTTTAKTYNDIAAVAIGITSQARTAALAYFNAIDDLKSARDALSGSRRLLASAENRFAMKDLKELELMKARAEDIEAGIQRLRALGEANALLADLNAATGTNYNEPPPDR